MTEESRKPGRRRRITPARRHTLARRDGLAWWLWGRTGPMWVYQCPGCKTLIRTGGATGGHIVPRGEGGGVHDYNLRIECLNCNEAENIARLLNGATHTERRIQRAQERRERDLLERRGRPKVFSNVPVFWDGRHLSFTSRRRADTFVRDGAAERLPEGGIRLLHAPRSSEPARTEPIENQCTRCGVLKGLTTFHFYPSWHPYARRLRLRRPSRLRPLPGRLRNRLRDRDHPRCGGDHPRVLDRTGADTIREGRSPGDLVAAESRNSSSYGALSPIPGALPA